MVRNLRKRKIWAERRAFFMCLESWWVEEELGFTYYKCVVIKSMHLAQVELGSHANSATHQLPGFGQMTSPL